MDKTINVEQTQLLASESIDASGDATTGIVKLSHTTGKTGLQYEITGDGTIKIEALESINGIDYITNGTEVATGLTKTPGKGLVAHDAGVNRFIKFKVTETGGANGVVVSLWVSKR